MLIHRVGQNRIYAPYYDRIFGGFPAKCTVYTPYMYGFGQPYLFNNSRVWLKLTPNCVSFVLVLTASDMPPGERSQICAACHSLP